MTHFEVIITILSSILIIILIYAIVEYNLKYSILDRYDKYFEPTSVNQTTDKLHANIDDDDSDFQSYNTGNITGWVVQFHHDNMIGNFRSYKDLQWNEIRNYLSDYRKRNQNRPIKKISLIPIFEYKNVEDLYSYSEK